MKEVIVSGDNVSKRLDVYLTELLGESRNFINKNIKNGNILVNDKTVKSGYSLRENDVIKINDYTNQTKGKLGDTVV